MKNPVLQPDFCTIIAYRCKIHLVCFKDLCLKWYMLNFVKFYIKGSIYIN